MEKAGKWWEDEGIATKTTDGIKWLKFYYANKRIVQKLRDHRPNAKKPWLQELEHSL